MSSDDIIEFSISATSPLIRAITSPLRSDVKNEIGKVVDWSKVDKEDYLLAMERSPVKDIEIKFLLQNALTNQITDREVYMKGIDHSYYYEGYTLYKTSQLENN